MRIFQNLFTFAFLIIAVQLIAQPTGPTTTIEFAETEHDFGQVKTGTTVQHVFTFTNTGNELLIISNAKGSCGCTVPQWPMDPILPGETASITVEFDSKGKRGMQNKKVTLTANTDPPQSFVYMKGEVLVEEEFQPGLIEPSIMDAAEPSPDCFTMYPNPTSDIIQLEMEKDHYGASATISIYSATGQLMAEREITAVEGPVVFDVSHYPAGTFIAYVQIGDGQAEARCFQVSK